MLRALRRDVLLGGVKVRLEPAVAKRWFATVPLLVVLCAAGLLRALRGAPHFASVGYVLGLVFLDYTGLAIRPESAREGCRLWFLPCPFSCLSSRVRAQAAIGRR